MKHFQDLNNLPEINFKSKERPALEELANYIDRMKQDLFDERWSQATKKHIKTSLVLYIRSMQKQLAPMGYHYKAVDMKGKQHLEHVIPQNRIITAYLHDKISSRWVLQMPLCLIDDEDKHILEGDWQLTGNWEYPFRRYKHAGFTKTIKDVKGNVVDLNSHTIWQHFQMLGVVDQIT
jgi:hypothetical protein|tara:strand:- start:92 stop:625 length:534 start_codon:yes stop_codon:yes gene_type:complete